MNFSLQDVHVLVTGASGGIGLETARLFLEQGAKVTAHYNTKSGPIQPLISEFGSAKVQSIQADLSKEADVVHLFTTSAQKPFGPVQVIVINHAHFLDVYVPVIDMSLEQWNTTLNADLTSPFLVAREYLRQLDRASDTLKEKASIVFVGSTFGKFGGPGHADYASSKSALMYGLTLTLKNEIVKIAPKGRVNSVGPGLVRTAMVEASLKNPDLLYRVLATTTLRKLAEPLDVARHIVILSSGVLSGHVSGQVVMIDGGMEGMVMNSREEVETSLAT